MKGVKQRACGSVARGQWGLREKHGEGRRDGRRVAKFQAWTGEGGLPRGWMLVDEGWCGCANEGGHSPGEMAREPRP